MIEAGGLVVGEGGLEVSDDGATISASSTTVDPLALSATSEIRARFSGDDLDQIRLSYRILGRPPPPRGTRH